MKSSDEMQLEASFPHGTCAYPANSTPSIDQCLPKTSMRIFLSWESQTNQSEMEDDAECKCDSDASECDCGFEDEKDEDNESEKTCEGSEAEFYYEMKDCRRERKKSLLEERKREEEGRNRQWIMRRPKKRR